MKNEMVIRNTTCFAEHEKNKLNCLKKTCRQWLDNPKSHNCVILAAKNGPLKQEIVGELLDLTRMRVCQIEKTILYKIRLNKNMKEIKIQ